MGFLLFSLWFFRVKTESPGGDGRFWEDVRPFYQKNTKIGLFVINKGYSF